jgi:putative ABC transport system substrate-binding protein
MRRRNFITLLGGAAIALPSVAFAQTVERIRRIGVITVFSEHDPEGQRRLVEFLKGMREKGWAEGRNLHIEYRWTGGDAERTRADVAALVSADLEAIVVNNALALPLLQRATRNIPIVFVSVSDPVAAGFVASLSRPGGNFTGFANVEFSWGEKLLEVLKEVAPQVDHVTVILHPDQAAQVGLTRTITAAGMPLGVQVNIAGARNSVEIERAIDAVASAPNGGLIVLANLVTNANRELIITRAAQQLLPAAYSFRYFVTSGGLMSYGPDPADQYWQAAGYVDRILKGERPAELPVQLPTKLKLVINLKTAKALGLTVPSTLLATADEVIE